MKPTIFVLLVASASCGKPGPAVAPTNDLDQRCRRQSDELSAFLDASDHDAQSISVLRDMSLVQRRGKLPPLHADVPVVYVMETTISVGGRLAENVEVLSYILDTIRSSRSSHPDEIDLAIEATVTWARVVSVVAAIRTQDFSTLRFVFTRPPATPPPPRTSADDRIDALARESGSRGQAVGTIAGEVIAPCSPLVRVLGAMTADTPADEVIPRIGPAVFACQCKLDLPAVRTVLWHMLANPNPVHATSVSFRADAPPLALPANTPWSEASQHLGAAVSSLSVAGS